MLQNLIIRNSSEIDIEISFEDTRNHGMIKINEQNYFLFSKSSRTFNISPGKYFVKFLIFHKTSTNHFEEIECPGFYEIFIQNGSKGDFNILINKKEINKTNLKTKIDYFFGEQDQFMYILQNSNFKHLLNNSENLNSKK